MLEFDDITTNGPGASSADAHNSDGFARAKKPLRWPDEHDQKVLRDRAISEQIWGKSYYTAFDDSEIASLGKFKKNIGRALVITGHRPNGETFYQMRPHGGGHRYLFPKGAGGALHVSPLTKEHLDDPNIPLLVNESIPKTDSAAGSWPDAEVCSIGFGGAFGFRGINAKSGKTVSDDLQSELIAWRGRDAAGNEFPRQVWILFDSDVQRNPNVLAAVRRVAAFMRSKGAAVHIVALPQPTDSNIKAIAIDDWRAANPSSTFADLCALELKEDSTTPPTTTRYKRQRSRSDFL